MRACARVRARARVCLLAPHRRAAVPRGRSSSRCQAGRRQAGSQGGRGARELGEGCTGSPTQRLQSSIPLAWPDRHRFQIPLSIARYFILQLHLSLSVALSLWWARRRVRVGPSGSAGEFGWALRAAQGSSGGPSGQRRGVRVGPPGSAGEFGWALRAAQGRSGGPSGQRRGARVGPPGSAGEFGGALRAAPESSGGPSGQRRIVVCLVLVLPSLGNGGKDCMGR